MAQQIQLRRGTSLQWAGINPVLGIGEIGLELDTLLIKIGDGVHNWNSLPYGLRGEKGDSGTKISGIAGEILSASRWVIPDINGKLIKANGFYPLGVTVNSCILNEQVDIVTKGEFIDSSWNWMPNQPIYFISDGFMSQTIPTSGFILEVAVAITNTSIYIDKKMPIILEV